MTAGWKGRRVLVTGASSGIGAAMARELASAGAIVGMCARRRDLLDDTLAACRRSVPESQAWTIDLTELDALEPFAHEVEAALGGIDVLINNAGGSDGSAALATPWGDLDSDLHRPHRLQPRTPATSDRDSRCAPAATADSSFRLHLQHHRYPGTTGVLAVTGLSRRSRRVSRGTTTLARRIGLVQVIPGFG